MLIATAREVGRVRAFVQEHAVRTAAGRRWLVRAAPHWPEIIGRISTSPVLQAETRRALREAARLVAAHAAGWEPIIDERTLVAGRRLLAALEVRASATLRRTLSEFRRDLEEMRGRRLAEVLGPARTPEPGTR